MRWGPSCLLGVELSMRVEDYCKEEVSREAESAGAQCGHSLARCYEHKMVLGTVAFCRAFRSECGSVSRTGGRNGYIVDVFSSPTVAS